MITGMRLQNFKSWKDTGQMRMAPLTGFFGTNSSGKTALLQFLMVMKQTVETNDQSRVLHTGDDKSYVDVGTFYDFIHKKQISKQISFLLDWKPGKLTNFLVGAETTEGFFKRKIEGVYVKPELLEFSSIIQGTEKRIYVKEFQYKLITNDETYVWGMRANNTRNNLEKEISYTFFSEGYDAIPILNATSDEEFVRDQPEPTTPVKNYRFPDTGFYLFSIKDIDNLIVSFETVFRRTYYLGPLREYPHRIYAWSGERPQDVGTRGEFAIPALLAKPGVTEYVAKWLKELKLVHDFKLKPIAVGRREHEALVQITPGATEVPITDVGFGISQILPVLVMCYYIPEGSTIIFEQPEIHLHPSVQAGLADVFIDVIKNRNLQIILESHSEHLLHRLQRRIAENQLIPQAAQKITSEQTALYFCELNDQGESVLDPLKMDKYGNISNWPENFFGDEFGDLVAMTEAEMKDKVQKGNQVPV
jgi:predicted ATPase